MVVPDAAVYAALPLLGGSAVWVGRQFVLSVSNKSREDDSSPNEMSVRSYREFMEIFKKELNGRYMFADEARKCFKDLEVKVDSQFNQLRQEMGQLRSLILKLP